MLKKYLRAVLGLKDKVIHKYLLLGWIVPPPPAKKRYEVLTPSTSECNFI